MQSFINLSAICARIPCLQRLQEKFVALFGISGLAFTYDWLALEKDIYSDWDRTADFVRWQHYKSPWS